MSLGTNCPNRQLIAQAARDEDVPLRAMRTSMKTMMMIAWIMLVLGIASEFGGERRWKKGSSADNEISGSGASNCGDQIKGQNLGLPTDDPEYEEEEKKKMKVNAATGCRIDVPLLRQRTTAIIGAAALSQPKGGGVGDTWPATTMATRIGGSWVATIAGNYILLDEGVDFRISHYELAADDRSIHSRRVSTTLL
ncbi:hypothetical protein NL676_030678 [Syzygium grande]|nr:hypothetical protein NL676_030678 [Syzygium grande]